MRRRFVFVLGALLSVLLVVSVVFGTGIVDVSKFSLLSAPMTLQPTQGGTSVFVEPAAVIKDYINDPGYQIGSKFTVHVNVSDVTDLFAWQINVTWNKNVLNVSNLMPGEFLLRTTSENRTAAFQLGFVINVTDNAEGNSTISESILDNRLGLTGVSGNGRLVSIEFLVVGYGCSNITIGLTGNLATSLLNSAGGAVTFTKTDGYFKNKLAGDSNGDGTVNVLDRGTLSGRWTGAPGALPYSRDVDNNDDGVINVLDRGITSANWGRTVP